MKKFFTGLPHQDPRSGIYRPEGNSKLGMDAAVHFPIIPAINGYVQAGESFRVIGAMTDKDKCRENVNLMQQEIDDVCRKTGAVCLSGVEVVVFPDDETVGAHVSNFQKLIEYVDDDDELFACITYGTKPAAMSLLMAIRYAYRIKRNTSVACIVYGALDFTKEDKPLKIYDMTALVQLDEVVRMLADKKVENPKETISMILSL